MKIIVDRWAWLSKTDLSVAQIAALRRNLTVVPRKFALDKEDPKPLHLFAETPTMFGVAREYALGNLKPHHQVELRVSNGDMSTWPGPLAFQGVLRPEQEQAVTQIAAMFQQGVALGGLLQASPGWGKTVATSYLMALLQVPTLVVVHKEFLMNQWQQRLTQFLPGIEIGICQQDTLDYHGKHVVLGMVHTLADRKFSDDFIRWPGLCITDECFPSGTAVATPVGARSIETLAVGDRVVCAAGVGIVSAVLSRNVARSSLRVLLFEDGTEQVCTAEHPFLTVAGWQPARVLEGRDVLTAAGCFDTMLRHGNEALPPLAGDVCAVREAESCARGQEVLLACVYGGSEAIEGTAPAVRIVWSETCKQKEIAFLFQCLSSEVVAARGVAAGSEDFAPGHAVAQRQPADCAGGVRTYDTTQSDAVTRNSESGQCRVTSSRVQTPGTRGEREGVDGSAEIVVGSVRGSLGDGARVADGGASEECARATEPLQTRYSARAAAGGDRGGWPYARFAESSAGGSQEREVPAFVRVVRVAVPKQNDLERLGISADSATGSVRVHNLTVDRHPSYVLAASGVLVHNCHRVGAATWSVVPSKFPARWRFGITATPRRKDGAEKVFQYHIGKILFTAKEQRLRPLIKRVHTTFRVVPTPNMPVSRMPRTLLISLLCGSPARIALVANQIVLAVQAGRKLLVLSERLAHLEAIHKTLVGLWPSGTATLPTIDYYVGGRTEKERELAAKARVILATSQFACVDAAAPIVDRLTGEVCTIAGLTEGMGVLPTIVGGTGSFSIQRPSGVGVVGAKECVEIEVVNSGKFVVSSDHLMWTDRGWVSAGSLVAGERSTYAVEADYLASPRILNIEAVPTDLSEDQAWLLGLLIGDGCLSQLYRGVAQLITDDPEIVAEASRILKSVGMCLKLNRHRHYDIRSAVGKSGRGRKTWLREVVERYDLMRAGRSKRLPSDLVQGPLPVAAALAAGLYDSDGGLTARGTICFGSCSAPLLEQLRTILLRLGVPVLHDLQIDAKRQFQLSLSREGARDFLRLVRSRLPRKAKHPGIAKLEINATNAVPPRFVRELRAALKTAGVSRAEAVAKCQFAGLSVSWTQAPFREMSLAAYELLAASIGFVGSLDRAVVWRRVVSVRSIGKRLVGDFSVPPTKAWTFGGVVVHNSEGLDIPALDTLILATPMSDVEQAVGRILRPSAGKKPPIVVDIRDDRVPIFRAMGSKRDQLYEKIA